MQLQSAGSDDRLQLWGGVECTVNRVGNRYFDQLELSGHARRDGDLDLCADLGITVLRYPLLWERGAPGNLSEASWKWSDERMNRLRERGITPIVGLLHHGSGPRHTSLLDDEFASKFAAYARLVAERYPWIRYVTPINEPLTTARFSALYGLWYPHMRSDAEFSRAFLNQLDGVRAAMLAMREVIPSLELIQTEDLGKVYASPRVKYQADFENERRWLTFDALCGRIDRGHPMWSYLRTSPADEKILENLVEDPCPPSILGINYYATSERLLDDRLELYPPELHARNGRDEYADVEAVRARSEGIAGHCAILRECWDRYRLPLAVTEAHLGCTREQQMRWLLEAWNGANAARKSGCDVRAVTAWALFGSFGWDSLVTQTPFSYESGAFDVRSNPPRETSVAKVIRSLAAEGSFAHPASNPPGWWRLPSRIRFGARDSVRAVTQQRLISSGIRNQPVLIAGATGTLGRALARACESRGLPMIALSRNGLDISDAAAVSEMIRMTNPWVVINAAGYVRVDEAERECNTCYRANSDGPANLAAVCASRGIQLTTFSTDLVFDGNATAPYTETDAVNPLNVYGASKANAEQRVSRIDPAALIIRTSAFFGPDDNFNFLVSALRSLGNGIPFPAANDATVSPTYVPDLANAVLDLTIDGERGVWHVSNAGATTWFDLANEVASRAGYDTALITPVPMNELGRAAAMPRYSALGSGRGSLLPSLDVGLDRFFANVFIEQMRAVVAC
ncbi:MAG TPA: dTDP-4-dehydrorhamnose reductase [Gemmatimonadaceae bacterium]|nr:dTDP-4-dehydrorhamnose reductase [Gemmatimonadaceae bacterium]